jgi:hypothetical protein
MINQVGYRLPLVDNYLTLKDGDSYSLSPISFHEFLSKSDAESQFFFSDRFFQIPQYERDKLEMVEIPDYARDAIRQYIIAEFENRLIGKQDYRSWGKRFEQRCISLTVPFWAQVNMQSIMTSKELETDENTSTRINTSENDNTGSQKTSTGQKGNGTNLSQQLSDSSSRSAQLTAVNTGDVVDSSLEVDWSQAADDFNETRTRAGDLQQKSENESISVTEVSNGGNTKATTISSDTAEYTNKQFMQERQWAIQTAQTLMPLEWLKTQLSGMFFLLR